jgi:hypothetical protein
LSEFIVSPIGYSAQDKTPFNIIPNTGQHFYVSSFTSIAGANFEFVEIFNHWAGEGEGV